MPELNTQDTQVITAEGCDSQLHNTQAVTSAWLSNQGFTAICDKESVNTSSLKRLEAAQGTARQRKLCHKDMGKCTERLAVQKHTGKKPMERTEL